MLVAIYACEGQYGGLHGIESSIIVEVNDRREANEIAEEESRGVMEGYSDIMEDFYSEAEDAGFEPDSEEYNNYVEDCILENISYQIFEVVDRYAPISQMSEDFFNDKEGFIEKHCREIE